LRSAKWELNLFSFIFSIDREILPDRALQTKDLGFTEMTVKIVLPKLTFRLTILDGVVYLSWFRSVSNHLVTNPRFQRGFCIFGQRILDDQSKPAATTAKN